MDESFDTIRYWYEFGMEFCSKKKASYRHKSDSHMRTFKQWFGCSPAVLMKCWLLLVKYNRLESGATPSHLLWACLFLKVYGKESIHAALAGCDEKTFRKWSWTMIEAIAYLESEVVR